MALPGAGVRIDAINLINYAQNQDKDIIIGCNNTSSTEKMKTQIR